MENIGAKIKEIRKRNKLKQGDLTGPNVSRGLISLIERSRSTPSLRTLDYLASRLGVTIGELLGESTNSKESSFENSENIQHNINVCETLFNAEKYDEAEYKLIEILQSENLSFVQKGDALKLLGKIYFEKGKFDKAIENIRGALLYIYKIEVSEVADTYLNLSNAYLSLNNYQASIESAIYAKILLDSESPSNQILIYLKTFFNLAFCYCRIGEYEKGLIYINLALKEMERTETFYSQGHFYMLKGLALLYLKDFNNGIEATRESLSHLNPEGDNSRYIGAKTNLGILYRNVHDYKQSILVLEECVKRSSLKNDSDLQANSLYELSLTYKDCDDWILTEKYLSEGIRHAKRKSILLGKLYYELSIVKIMKEDYNDALDSINKAKEILNDKVWWLAKVYTLEAKVHIHLNESQEALEKYKIATDTFSQTHNFG